MVLPAEIRDELIAHAREEAPAECCGIVATAGDRAMRSYRARNTFASELKYNLDGRDLIRIYTDIDERGWELGVIYHSHTRSDPYPSQTDINLATYPDAIYMIVGIAGPEPDVRGFRIVDRQVDEVQIEVE